MPRRFFHLKKSSIFSHFHHLPLLVHDCHCSGAGSFIKYNKWISSSSSLSTHFNAQDTFTMFSTDIFFYYSREKWFISAEKASTVTIHCCKGWTFFFLFYFPPFFPPRKNNFINAFHIISNKKTWSLWWILYFVNGN